MLQVLGFAYNMRHLSYKISSFPGNLAVDDDFLHGPLHVDRVNKPLLSFVSKTALVLSVPAHFLSPDIVKT